MEPSRIAFGIAWYVIFLFATVLHEAAHALAARLGGDVTAESQITLDPIPHIRREPFGMVLVPWLMFLTSPNGSMMGWASTPFDPAWALRNPHRAAWMALAGPVSNGLLAVLVGVVIRAGLAFHWFGGSSDASIALEMLLIAFNLNVILAVLNMLPLPPLDGATALTLLMPEQAARRWQEQLRNPAVSMLTLVAVWIAFPRVASVALHWAQGWLRP